VAGYINNDVNFYISDSGDPAAGFYLSRRRPPTPPLQNPSSTTTTAFSASEPDHELQQRKKLEVRLQTPAHGSKSNAPPARGLPSRQQHRRRRDCDTNVPTTNTSIPSHFISNVDGPTAQAHEHTDENILRADYACG